MADLRPFRGWRYDPDVVGDPGLVLCPPYDMVTPELQESLRRRSPYNVVHLEAGEGLDWASPAAGQYSSAAALFEQWTGQGVLRRDREPGFYLLRQGFQSQGRHHSRLGLIACVRLEEYESRQVLPHEYTEEPAIRDRVSLMEKCDANFSPIMSLYRDTASELAPAFQEAMSDAPVLDVRDDSEQSFTLWRIAGPRLQEHISRFFSDKAVFLADGHHRYEAALKFAQLRREQEKGSAQPGAAYNFVMMTLIGFDDPGLAVLPYHRLVGGLSPDRLSQVRERLDRMFERRPISLTGDQRADNLVEEVARHGRDRHALGLVGPEEEGAFLLALREGVDWRQWGPQAVSEAWILEEQVLKPVLGDATLDHLGFIHDHTAALGQVASGARQMAFLLKPFPMAQFEAIVGDGHRLPRKSTFFYPKLPTGLVINQLEGSLL